MAMNTYSGDTLPTKDVGRPDEQVKVRCDCGGWEWPFLMIDITSLPQYFTEGQDFACGGCVSTWRRTLKPFSPADKFYHWSEWNVEWVSRHGGDTGPEIQVMQDRMARSIKLLQDRENAYEGHPESQRLKAKRMAMQARL